MGSSIVKTVIKNYDLNELECEIVAIKNEKLIGMTNYCLRRIGDLNGFIKVSIDDDEDKAVKRLVLWAKANRTELKFYQNI